MKKKKKRTTSKRSERRREEVIFWDIFSATWTRPKTLTATRSGISLLPKKIKSRLSAVGSVSLVAEALGKFVKQSTDMSLNKSNLVSDLGYVTNVTQEKMDRLCPNKETVLCLVYFCWAFKLFFSLFLDRMLQKSCHSCSVIYIFVHFVYNIGLYFFFIHGYSKVLLTPYQDINQLQQSKRFQIYF